MEELYDAVCVADGLFLFLVCLIVQLPFCNKSSRFDVLRHENNGSGKKKDAPHIFLIAMAITGAGAYGISLFRFAETGFFSLNGGAAWLVIYGFVLKFLIGVRLLVIAYVSNRYNRLKKAFDVKKSDESLHSGGSGGGGNWNMDAIEVTEKKDTRRATEDV